MALSAVGRDAERPGSGTAVKAGQAAGSEGRRGASLAGAAGPDDPRAGIGDEAASDEMSPRQGEVLDAVLALLVEGREALTMTAVARRAKCSKETLYKWFGDRDGLLTATVQWQASRVRAGSFDRQRLDAAARESHVHDAAQTVMLRVVVIHEHQRGRGGLFLKRVARGKDPVVAGRGRNLRIIEQHPGRHRLVRIRHRAGRIVPVAPGRTMRPQLLVKRIGRGNGIALRQGFDEGFGLAARTPHSGILHKVPPFFPVRHPVSSRDK